MLLGIWFLASFGAGILLADPLNELRIPGTGFRVGFWFAQQGSIYVFVALVFTYVRWMNRLDRRYGVAEEEDPAPEAASEGVAAESSPDGPHLP